MQNDGYNQAAPVQQPQYYQPSTAPPTVQPMAQPQITMVPVLVQPAQPKEKLTSDGTIGVVFGAIAGWIMFIIAVLSFIANVFLAR